MRLVLVLDDGTAETVVEHPDGYNLANPIARAFFIDRVIAGAKRVGVDLTIAREAPEARTGDD